MICLTTPFYRGHLEGYFPGHLRVLYCVRVDYRTPRDCSSPRLVAMASLACPVESCFGCRGLEG